MFQVFLHMSLIMRQEEEEFNMNNKNEDDIQRMSFRMLEMEDVRGHLGRPRTCSTIVEEAS